MVVPYSFIWAYSFIRELRVTGQVLFFAIGSRRIAKAGWEHISCQCQSRNSSSFYYVDIASRIDTVEEYEPSKIPFHSCVVKKLVN